MGDLVTALSTDNRHLKISIISDDGVELSNIILPTETVETLLTELGRTRAQMDPPVIRKVEPNPVFRDVTRETVFHVNRPHVVSKEFFIAARHEGFGWLAFSLGPETGILLSNLILRQVEAITPKIVLPNKGIIT